MESTSDRACVGSGSVDTLRQLIHARARVIVGSALVASFLLAGTASAASAATTTATPPHQGIVAAWPHPPGPDLSHCFYDPKWYAKKDCQWMHKYYGGKTQVA